MKTEKRQSTGVDNPTRYWISADHHLRELAENIGDTYMDHIIGSIVNQPRSQQRRIGPSEMGQDCSRAILHRLNGDRPAPRKQTPWKPTIGTAVHAYLEDVFETASKPGEIEEGRWLVENRVTITRILDEDITGSTDLFDTWQRVVLDHKIVGNFTLRKYRANGPSNQYRNQAHLYGKGWKDRGYDVQMVAICFLPREGELTDSFIWTEPYDEQVALDAIERCDRLTKLLAVIGIEKAIEMFPPCTDHFCDWCKDEDKSPAVPTATAVTGLF